jgi:hypothetical protein
MCASVGVTLHTFASLPAALLNVCLFAIFCGVDVLLLPAHAAPQSSLHTVHENKHCALPGRM